MCQSPYSPLRKKIPTHQCPHCGHGMRYVSRIDSLPSNLLIETHARSWAWSRYRYFCQWCQEFTDVTVETGEVIGNGVPVEVHRRRRRRRSPDRDIAPVDHAAAVLLELPKD